MPHRGVFSLDRPSGFDYFVVNTPYVLLNPSTLGGSAIYPTPAEPPFLLSPVFTSPISVLRVTLRHCDEPDVRLIPQVRRP